MDEESIVERMKQAVKSVLPELLSEKLDENKDETIHQAVNVFTAGLQRLEEKLDVKLTMFRCHNCIGKRIHIERWIYQSVLIVSV